MIVSPTSQVREPTVRVAKENVISDVPRASLAGNPASEHSLAISVAIADRKIRPTSWTWPDTKKAAEIFTCFIISPTIIHDKLRVIIFMKELTNSEWH
jgi:hypothetical protein